MFKFLSGVIAGYVLFQGTWVLWQLAKADPRKTLTTPQNRWPKGITLLREEETEAYRLRHVIEDGIERISYYPKQRRFETPLLMQHGMWHGAWCWEDWQKLFAEWGWESHSISQPGHGKSPVQRPIHKCTLDYYLAFLRDEAERLPRKPVILGHSMGGAITQWYLKYVGDIPAAVLVASWVRHSALWDGAPLLLSQDPSIFWRMMLSWDASSWVRNPRRAAEKLIGPKAPISPEELYARLGPESALVTFQHNPPIWSPPENLPIPTLWLAGELDTVVSVPGLRKSARIYGGDFVLVPEAGHNLMMEHNARQTAQTIHDWLVARAIP